MAFKYRGNSKIKYAHHIIQGLRPLLESIQPWPEIKSIIPGRINRTASNSGDLKIKFQYETPTGIKCLAIAKGCVQEVFFVSPNTAVLIDKLSELR